MPIHSQILKRTALIALLPLLSLKAATPEEILAQPVTAKTGGLQEQIAGRVVTDIISRSHYQPHAIDPALSAQWFNAYFETLDPGKMFFYQSDIDRFRPFEGDLWNTKQHLVNLDFAFKVYELYLHRVREWAIFSCKALKETHDYSVDEALPIDIKALTWCKDEAEIHDLWRRKVKNALLNDEIVEAQKKEEAQKKDKTYEPPTEDAATRLAKSYAHIYKRKLESEPLDILEIFLSSLTTLYDPHSNYMAPETKESFDINMRLSLQGIGATLSSMDSYTTIVDIVPGGPADKDGRLKAGDRISAVAQDGEDPVDVTDMSLNKVVKLIRGPKGTTVHLTILPEGSNTPQLIDIVRDEVKLTEQEAQSEIREITVDEDAKADVLVIYLPSFYADFGGKKDGKDDYKSTTRDIRNLIESRKAEKGMPNGLILDLRGNSGGSLDEAISLTGLFTGRQVPVVQIRQGNNRIIQKDSPNEEALYTGPMLVLVDKHSASASEIVAAALQDMGRAFVIGDQSTHGKGSVQTILDLNNYPIVAKSKSRQPDLDIGSLKLTIAKFYRINGSSTQEKGVTPDIIFPSFYDYMELGESKIPHCLPWDTIDPVKSYPRNELLATMLPKLKEASTQRREQNQLFKEYLQDIAYFKQWHDIKALPLERTARNAYNDMEEKATGMRRKFLALSKQTRDRLNRNKGVEGTTLLDPDALDLILEESLQIMGDILRLGNAPANWNP